MSGHHELGLASCAPHDNKPNSDLEDLDAFRGLLGSATTWWLVSSKEFDTFDASPCLIFQDTAFSTA